MKSPAIVLTNGMLRKDDAKTAHGLIRGSERFEVVAVIDGADTAGRDAGVILDGKPRDIPIFANLDDALAGTWGVRYLVIGVATVGGRLPADMLEIVRLAIRAGLSIVNGLHEFLCDKQDIASLAHLYQAELIDVRKPKTRDELHFWTGDIKKVDVPVVAVMGMDCAMGKRTTARLLREACESKGMRAEMIYTGQTGWMQGGKYGFILDATLNDFVTGELEHAILQCWREANPEIIFLEGQSGLRNPSGPCGPEFLISGRARHAVLMFSPKRKYWDHNHNWGEIPDVLSEIKLIEAYGTKVIALGMHTEGCAKDEAMLLRDRYEKLLSRPVLLPIQEGVDKLIPALKTLVETEKKKD
jgi:uncharacterized NAD-dependent epimerase/dehydratase family protein